MTVMVAFALNTEPLFKTATRARGQDRSYVNRTSPRTNSPAHANLREAAYVGSVRLGTCSKDPIGYDGSEWNLYEYVKSSPAFVNDPMGLQGHKVWKTCGSLRYQDDVRYPTYGCCNGQRFNLKKGFKCKDGNIVSPFAGGGIFICTREVRPGTPCKTVIDACGGQHTYIQFGGLTPKGDPEVGTGGIGFSGPGKTPPGDEHSFHPSRCTRLHIPEGMTSAQAETCIRSHAPTKPFTFPNYVCSTWANEAVDSCGLTRGESFAW